MVDLHFWKVKPFTSGALVALWVKRWPAALATVSSSSASGEIFSTVNKVSFYIAFHYRPDMTEILLKRKKNR